MDRNKFFKRVNVRPTEELQLLTRSFYANSVEIYEGFERWKSIDRFYFTPLYLEMTYCIGGIPAEFAPDPVWLGSFVQCTLIHPDLFQYKCPKCCKTILPYRYVGSPLSGRVDLEGRCSCGWKGYEMVSGWFIRGEALRKQLAADKLRYKKFRLLHPGSEAGTVGELMEWLTLIWR